ncbi:MAG: hypothetical protein LC754_10550 [Acidobacteria bacterium]|nr:hypothetical protein [Acidobacteriota bacterium]
MEGSQAEFSNHLFYPFSRKYYEDAWEQIEKYAESEWSKTDESWEGAHQQ